LNGTIFKALEVWQINYLLVQYLAMKLLKCSVNNLDIKNEN